MAMDHGNVAKIHQVFEDDYTITLVTDLCKGTDLYERIAFSNEFSENQAAVLLYQILSGLIETHSHGIVHRDLKPESLVFSGHDDSDFLKITDFGLSRFYKGEVRPENDISSAYYVAPEAIQGSYDEKCDVWSCGVILYTMLSGSPPFTGDSEAEIHANINEGSVKTRGSKWTHIS